VAIISGHLKVAIRGEYLGQRVEVVQWYRLVGSAFLTADVVQVLEAYWNDIKTDWRAFHVASPKDLTLSLFGSEAGPTGQYAEYAIPTGEQQGTRSSIGLGDFMPPTIGVGIRLTVGSRATRPGQKRPWGSLEGDNVDGAAQAAIVSAANAVAPVFSGGRVLGVPVATGVMQGEVVRLDPISGLVTTAQDLIGFVVNSNLTTQNSRKVGHGT
jgi:hypothetical protein